MNLLRCLLPPRLCAALLSLLVAACGSGDAPEGGLSATALVGPAGGTVALPDGSFALAIPAGALSGETRIVVTALAGADVPAALAHPTLERTYRLEPSGLRFAVPARATVTLPRGAAGDLVLLALASGETGAIEVAAGPSIDETEAGLVLQADVAHFSYALVNRFPGVVATLTGPATVEAGQSGSLEMLVAGTSDEALELTTDGATGPYLEPTTTGAWSTLVLLDLEERSFSPGVPNEARGRWIFRCDAPGRAEARWGYVIYNPLVSALYAGLLSVGAKDVHISRTARTTLECVAPPPPQAQRVSLGLLDLPGLTAPDGIHYFTRPFASAPGDGPLAAVAGAEGVLVLDLATRAVVLDRTSEGPDGATLGTRPLGVLAVARSDQAGAPAALVGFGNGGSHVQNHHPTNGWGGTARDTATAFDAVAVGGGSVADSAVVVRPTAGVQFVDWDDTAGVYRSAPGRTIPLADFPAGGQLVSAQAPGGTDLLVLSRATGAGPASSTQLFHKAIGDTQAATALLSLGQRDARRLRCIPVGPKQACVATLFDGEALAFLFDPASPRDTPRVTPLTAEAGTLGVALAPRPDGRVLVALANFQADSLTVAELSADLATVHERSTLPAPEGCTGTAHVALVTDTEGLKSIVSCNGTHRLWIALLRP